MMPSRGRTSPDAAAALAQVPHRHPGEAVAPRFEAHRFELAAGAAFEFVAPAGELLEFSKAPREPRRAGARALGETEQHRPFPLAARRPAGGQMREAPRRRYAP